MSTRYKIGGRDALGRPRTSRHEYYVYHSGEVVYARRREEPPVVAETCATAQAAADKVQAIVNPTNRLHTQVGPRGFHEESFQAAISGHCQAYVEAAYARAAD